MNPRSVAPAEAPPDAPTVRAGDELLPGYRALSLLSRGNRLDVYDAWSGARRCRCIVKLARPDRRREPSVQRRLLDEGGLLRRLDHPHWVRLYEVVVEPEPALVLQTLAGTTLAALLDDERRLGAADVMIMGAQIASAVSYLHDLGYLHLDLTPTNVVASGGLVTLIDLSHARSPGRAPRIEGTAGYRSPERLAGADLTPATDVWGLGLLLHEALSGREPGSGSGRSDGAPPLRRRRRLRRLPRHLVDLVDACLADRSEDRPPLPVVLAELGGVPPGLSRVAEG